MFDSLFSRNGLSLDRLRSLVEVDNAGGIADAAPGDPVRQSQISRNLAQLERFFGTELKRRKGKGIELTPAGSRLAALARAHLQSMEDFLGAVAERPLELRIGASQSALEWSLLPRLAENFSGDRFRFTLASLRSHEIVRGLNDFSLDLGIVRESALTTKRLRHRALATVRYVLVAPVDLVRRYDGDPLTVLRHVPLATSMGGEYRRKFDEFVRGEGVAPDVRYSCSSFRTALELLKRHDQIAALLPDSVGGELSEDRFTSLALPFLRSYQRDLVLAWHERIEDLRPEVALWGAKLASPSP